MIRCSYVKLLSVSVFFSGTAATISQKNIICAVALGSPYEMFLVHIIGLKKLEALYLDVMGECLCGVLKALLLGSVEEVFWECL